MGDHPEHPLLLRNPQARLEADQIPHAAATVLHPKLRDRVLPRCLLSALHRFHASNSIQDAAAAAHESAERYGGFFIMTRVLGFSRTRRRWI